jgi:hypothetical protein
MGERELNADVAQIKPLITRRSCGGSIELAKENVKNRKLPWALDQRQNRPSFC